MKQIIILFAFAITIFSCDKKNGTTNVIVEPPPPVPVDTTVYLSALQGHTFTFDKSSVVKFSSSATGNTVYYIDIDNAVVGSTITYTTPCNNMTGFEVRTVENATFQKKNEGADYSIKKTSTSLTVTYKYIGVISGNHTFEWYDTQN